MIYNIYLNKNVKVFKLNTYILTGQIGAGKSEAQKILQELSYSCFCADSMVRNLYKKDYIIEKLGAISSDLVDDGVLNTDLLRKLVFNNNDIMQKVENFIQPIIFSKFQEIENKYKNNIIFIMPIIKNSVFFKKYEMIYIFSDELIRRKRVEKRENYDEDMIDNIFNYQNSIDNYINISKYSIENNGTISDLKEKIIKIIE